MKKTLQYLSLSKYKNSTLLAFRILSKAIQLRWPLAIYIAILTIFSCNRSFQPNTFLEYYSKNHDSVLNYMLELPKQQQLAQKTYDIIYRFGDIGDTVFLKKAQEKIPKFAFDKTKIKSHEILLNAIISKYLQNFKQSESYFEQCKSHINTDPVFNLNYFLKIGYAAYMNNPQSDLPISYFEKSLEAATTLKNLTYCTLIESNIGGLYMNKGFFNQAMNHFSKAYEYMLENDRKLPMLINNLMVSYMRINRYKEALELYKKELEPLDEHIQPYQKQLFDLNACQICLNLGDIGTYKKIIEPYRFEEILPQFKFNFIKNSILYHINYNSKNNHQLNQYESFCEQNPLATLNELQEEIIQHQNNTWIINLITKPTFVNFLDTFTDGPSKIPNYYYLRSLTQNFNGSTVPYLQNHINQLNQLIKSKDSSGLLDTRLVIESKELEKRRREASIKFENEKSNHLKMIIGLIFLLLIATLFAFVIAQKFKLQKKINEQIIELNSLTKEKNEALINEKIWNDKHTAISKEIVNKTKKWASELRSGPYSNTPEIKNVWKDILSISLAQDLFNSNEENQYFPDHLNQLLKSFPKISELNNTEKRVLNLLVNGVEPKRIGILLEKNPYYVRNIKSKIRLLLDLPIKFDFTSLKET